jgi:hypothetical protein
MKLHRSPSRQEKKLPKKPRNSPIVSLSLFIPQTVQQHCNDQNDPLKFTESDEICKEDKSRHTLTLILELILTVFVRSSGRRMIFIRPLMVLLRSVIYKIDTPMVLSRLLLSGRNEEISPAQTAF